MPTASRGENQFPVSSRQPSIIAQFPLKTGSVIVCQVKKKRKEKWGLLVMEITKETAEGLTHLDLLDGDAQVTKLVVGACQILCRATDAPSASSVVGEDHMPFQPHSLAARWAHPRWTFSSVWCVETYEKNSLAVLGFIFACTQMLSWRQLAPRRRSSSTRPCVACSSRGRKQTVPRRV